ncbi:FadR family transcriptional regulator [Xanthomonas sp. CFBP 8703]|uniref:FadR family transcriptional regulator n=1 Tax=Xanthomonas bonasiae TaxID=2810351 RepID=A0ABS3B2C7_9XANT|nr:FadR/GntR family transcriptional regulator [Xanthomonas bonasiae]MBN6101034.1 FadR family transcriptional regulator [Xanthomonas bonasiae]
MKSHHLGRGARQFGSTTLSSQLLDALGRDVVAGIYGLQSFPTEAEISSAYSTSRSVTREAIKMLTAKGLLSARPRSGIVVRPEQTWSLLDPDVLRWMLERKFSHSLLRSFTEMRQGIEPMAAKLAAQQGNAEAIGKIQHALQRMIAAGRGEDDHLSSDVAFHVAILDATGNPFYMQFHELVNTALSFSIQFTNRIGGHTASIPAHRRVLNAIKSGDGDKAHAAMFTIIHDVLSLIAGEESREAKKKKRS